LLSVQNNQSIRVLASIIRSMLEKPRSDIISQKLKSICRSCPGRKLSVEMVCPFGG